MRWMIAAILIAAAVSSSAQTNVWDGADSLRHYGNLYDRNGDRDAALGYYSRALDKMMAKGEIHSARYWEIVYCALADVRYLYGAHKAMEVADDYLGMLKYPEPVAENRSLYDVLGYLQELAFQGRKYGKSIWYGHWRLIQMEALRPFSADDYYRQCLQILGCYRLQHRPLDDCYDALAQYAERCRRITGTIPPDFVEQHIQLDIENNFYASALQHIGALRQFYKNIMEADTSHNNSQDADTLLCRRFAENLLQGGHLYVSINQCEKALKYLGELGGFLRERNIADRDLLYNLYHTYGLVYQRSGQPEKALEAYSKALEYHTDTQDCYDARIECFLSQAECHELGNDFLNALSLSNKACRYSSVNKSRNASHLATKSRIK